MEKIKPCPFCGGDAIVIHTKRNTCYVVCNNIKCIYQPYPAWNYDTADEAIVAWNRRKGNVYESDL